jgi:hypothetical protein
LHGLAFLFVLAKEVGDGAGQFGKGIRLEDSQLLVFGRLGAWSGLLDS